VIGQINLVYTMMRLVQLIKLDVSKGNQPSFDDKPAQVKNWLNERHGNAVPCAGCFYEVHSGWSIVHQ